MKKPINPTKSNGLFPDLDTDQPKDGKPCRCKFSGTSNPRHIRVLRLVVVHPEGVRRKRVDAVAGASNGPELIAELRRRGLGTDLESTCLPCERIRVIDRDGLVVHIRKYRLTRHGREEVLKWFARSKTKLIDDES